MKAEPERDLTRALAEEMTALTFARLAAEDVAQIKRLMLDHVGVCLCGASLPWGVALEQWATTYAGTGPSVVFGTPLRAAPAVAALVNATAAHGLELDDTHDSSVSHPGAVVIATALAVGSARRASGQDILAAIAAGYETMARIGRATRAGEMIEHGFHPTALFGGFSAVTTAAKLMGLSAQQMVEAWGLMLSMAGGSMQFSEDPHGTTVKRLHGGYGAHNGTMAAEFAALGIAGPAQAFDGRYGLCRLFAEEPDIAQLAKANGAPLEIHRISLKPYPCCRLFHSTIDALRAATDDFSLRDDAIASIKVGGPAIMVTQHMMRRPASMMAAQYSLPFTLGASLAAGPRDHTAYAEDKLADARILALADKVEAVEDAEMEAAFPEHFGSWVEVKGPDGQTRREAVLDSEGTPARPMDEAAIRDKVAGLLAGLPGAPEVQTLADVIWSLEAPERPQRLVALCAAGKT